MHRPGDAANGVPAQHSSSRGSPMWTKKGSYPVAVGENPGPKSDTSWRPPPPPPGSSSRERFNRESVPSISIRRCVARSNRGSRCFSKRRHAPRLRRLAACKSVLGALRSRIWTGTAGTTAVKLRNVSQHPHQAPKRTYNCVGIISAHSEARASSARMAVLAAARRILEAYDRIPGIDLLEEPRER